MSPAPVEPQAIDIAPTPSWDRLQRTTERTLIGLLVDNAADPATASAIQNQVTTLRRDLLGERPSAIDQQPIDRIVSCWLMVHHSERRQALTHQVMGLGSGASAELVDRQDRRVAAAHRELASAIRTLVTTRRLLGPIQINIAEAGSQQLNVATGGTP